MPRKKTVYSLTVIGFIKDSIRARRLLPGQKVCEQSIASEMSVSRAPVREALNVLLGEGLLIAGPYMGKVVTALNTQEICDAYTLGGAAYGVMLTHSLPQYTSKDCAQLEKLARGFEKLTTQDVNFDEYDKLRRRLHEQMLKYAMCRWDMRLLTYCGNLSDCLLHQVHRQVINPAYYLRNMERAIEAIRKKNVKDLEEMVHDAFKVMGHRLSVAGYDNTANGGACALDKRFYMYKRRQPAVEIMI